MKYAYVFLYFLLLAMPTLAQESKSNVITAVAGDTKTGVEGKPSDPIAMFGDGDQKMNDAIKTAQSRWGEFVAAIDEESRRVVPALDDALVKYAFKNSGVGVAYEHMFLSDIHKRGGKLYGTLNSEPEYVKNVKEGDVVEIDPAHVSDWLYVVNGKGVGGFTFRVMWESFTKQEKIEYRNQPPFVWLDLPN